MKKALVMLVTALFILPLFAQSEETTLELAEKRYGITEVIYKIDGMTRPYLLEKKLGYPTGKDFDSLESLVGYIENIRQQLINYQFFSNIEVFYEIAELSDVAVVPVTVSIALKDELTLMIMPGPKYSSNSGLSLKLKYKDNNFLGSMESVYTNFEFNQNYDDEEKKSTPEIAIDMSFCYPFSIQEHNFKAIFDTDISFQNINTSDYAYSLKFNLGVENDLITRRDFLLIAGFSQGIAVNDHDDKYNVYEGDELYYTEEVYTKASFLLADFGKWGKLNYNPQLSMLYNWDMDGIKSVNTDLSSPKAVFSHSLNFGQINRVGLFRRGISADVSNSYSYDINRNVHSLSVTTIVNGFYNLFSHFGINSQLGFFDYLETSKNSATFKADGDENRGSYIRGIRDHRIKTDIGIYFSLDTPIHVFSFNAKKIAQTYFPDSKFMNSVFGALGFDFILSPFFDMMLTHYNNNFYPNPDHFSNGDRYFSLKDGWYAVGVDFIVVPHKFKSQYIRIGIGWDLQDLLKQKKLFTTAERDGESIYEIYLGLSLAY